MAISKLAETDILVLQEIGNSHSINQEKISQSLDISESTISRSICRLQSHYLVRVQRVYKSKVCTLNRHKMREITQILTLFEKCKSAILNENKSVVIVHDIEISSSVYVPHNYTRADVTKYFTLYRKGINLTLSEASVNIIIGNIDSVDNTAQILLRPYILIIDNANYKTEQQIKDLVNSEVIRIYESVNESLKCSNLFLKGIKNISEESLAIQDDWLPSFAIKHGLKQKFSPLIDDSRRNDFGELEFNGEEACKVLSKTIEMRNLFNSGSIKETQVWNAVDFYHKNIGSPIPILPTYALNSGVSYDNSV